MENYTVRSKNIFVEIPKSDVQVIGDFSKPTLIQFNAIQQAYDFYNKELFYPVFGKKLPPVMFSLNDSIYRKSAGYYEFDKYKDNLGNIFSLINITPKILANNLYYVMSFLIHEMAHHYQYHFGIKKGKKSDYHDKEFSKIMENMGLMCCSIPDGKKTGRRMSHTIIKGGKFELLTAFAPDKISIPFELNTQIILNEYKTLQEETIKVQKQKIKYQCPKCEIKVWGKPNLEIHCTPCNCKLE